MVYQNSLFPNYKKSSSGWGSPPNPHSLRRSPLDPRLWYVWVTLVYSTRLQFRHFQFLTFGSSPLSFSSKILVKCQTQAKASDLPFYNIFVPQKIPLSKIWLRHCMRFMVWPLSPNQNPGYAFERLPLMSRWMGGFATTEFKLCWNDRKIIQIR